MRKADRGEEKSHKVTDEVVDDVTNEMTDDMTEQEWCLPTVTVQAQLALHSGSFLSYSDR